MRRFGIMMAVLGMLIVVGAVVGCNRQEAIPVEDQKEAMPPADGAGAAAPAPAAASAGTTYEEGQVIGEKVEGHEQFDEISSTYPCKTEEDCTFTKFENAPKTENDCTCQASCTPYVVNKAEAQKRKAANDKCGPDDWFGPMCPETPCRFQEFAQFKCVGGVCVGLAMGKPAQ